MDGSSGSVWLCASGAEHSATWRRIHREGSCGPAGSCACLFRHLGTQAFCPVFVQPSRFPYWNPAVVLVFFFIWFLPCDVCWGGESSKRKRPVFHLRLLVRASWGLAWAFRLVPDVSAREAPSGREPTGSDGCPWPRAAGTWGRSRRSNPPWRWSSSPCLGPPFFE